MPIIKLHRRGLSMLKGTSCWAISLVCSVKSETLSGCVHDQMHGFKCVFVRVHVALCHYLCEWVGLNKLVIDYTSGQTHQMSRNKMLTISQRLSHKYFQRLYLLHWSDNFYSKYFLHGSSFLQFHGGRGSYWICLDLNLRHSWCQRCCLCLLNVSMCKYCYELIPDFLFTARGYDAFFLSIWTTLKTSDTTENISPRLSTFKAPGGRTRGTISRRYQKQSRSQFHIAFIVPPSLLGAQSVVIPNENECPSTPCQHINTCTCTNLQFTSSAPEFPQGGSPSIWFLIPSPYKLFVCRKQLLMLIPQRSKNLLDSPSFNNSYNSEFFFLFVQPCRHLDVMIWGERWSRWKRRGAT